jgi:phenylacetate-CoA ligase
MAVHNKPVYRLIDLIRRTDALRCLEEIRAFQWRSPAAIAKYQAAALASMLQHCYEQVPFYREVFDTCGWQSWSSDPLVMLRRLPVLDRQTVQAQRERFFARNAAAFQPRPSNTGGTTGRVLHYAISRAAHSASVAYNMLQWEDAGYQLGDKMIYLGGASLYPSLRSVISWGYTRLQNLVPLSSFDMDEQRIDLYISKIKKAKARFMRGYAGSIALLARQVIGRGRADVRFDAIFTTAETLYPHFRQTIEQAFRCKVFNEYGARDGSILAFECSRHEGLHISSSSCIVEILDGASNPVPPGTTGDVVLTSLDNFAFPFIRYRNGDRAVLSAKPCSCGRGLPLFQDVEGRSGDFITSPKGVRVHSEFFSHIFWEYPRIKQFQVRQDKGDEVDILLVLDGGRRLSSAEEERIRELIQSRCGDRMRVRVETLDNIPLPPSGKARYVVSMIG